jgi:large subunit ribosomal protein L6
VSRIGLNPINIPEKVKVDLQDGLLKVQGPKGTLEVNIPDSINLNIENNQITFSRDNETKKVKSMHGLIRSLTNNAIIGVSDGIKKVLKIEGIGYKVEMIGNNLLLSLGFSHPVCVVPPDGIEFKAPNPSTIEVTGIDKQLIGQTASVIRKLRKPEPYKGKGIRYEGEYVRRKAGKTGA